MSSCVGRRRTEHANAAVAPDSTLDRVRSTSPQRPPGRERLLNPQTLWNHGHGPGHHDCGSEPPNDGNGPLRRRAHGEPDTPKGRDRSSPPIASCERKRGASCTVTKSCQAASICWQSTDVKLGGESDGQRPSDSLANTSSRHDNSGGIRSFRNCSEITPPAPAPFQGERAG